MLRFRCCLALTRRSADIRRVYSCMGVASPRSLCHLIVRVCSCIAKLCVICVYVYPLCVCTLFWLFALCFFFSGEIFRRILQACNTFGFICYAKFCERNFIAFERVCFYRVDKENFLIIRKLLKISRWKKWTLPLAKNVLSYYPVARWKFAFWRLLIVFRIFSFHPNVWFLKIRLFRVFFNNW